MVKIDSIIAELNVKKINKCKYISKEDIIDITSRNGLEDIFTKDDFKNLKSHTTIGGITLYSTNDLIKKFKNIRVNS